MHWYCDCFSVNINTHITQREPQSVWNKTETHIPLAPPATVLPQKQQSLFDNTVVRVVGLLIPIVVAAFVIKKYWKL